MYIEFGPKWNSGYMDEFARKLNSEIRDNVLYLPSRFGQGYAKRIDIDSDLRVIIHSYNLKEPITFNRVATNTNKDSITFRFICYLEQDKNYLSNVQVLNDTIDVKDELSANTPFCNVIVKIKLKKLLSIINIGPKSKEFAAFTDNLNRPFIYQENVTLGMKEILRELYENKEHGKLEKLYYKIKIMDLMYHFFIRFSRRASNDSIHFNKNDIEKILSIEKIILNDLSIPPTLNGLAHSIGMSETKMKQLFKKVFGDSIYNYYLSARINEAASLLKSDKSMTIADVGYALGFSNLSHFSKLFKRYTGKNPKEYAMRK
ncbi:MAG: AraC family transcriptional regulator [Bacteroidales bacterium]|jgi:AraC-like DNA-binding protein|nr:AraC family transcriptional regulator [Bacteroidales bacterium]